MYTVVRKLIHIQYICMYPTLIHTNTLIHILTYTHELGLGDIAIIVHIMILFHPVELLLSVTFRHKHGIRLLYYLFQIQIHKAVILPIPNSNICILFFFCGTAPEFQDFCCRI